MQEVDRYQETSHKKNRKRSSIWRELCSLLIKIGAILLLFLFVTTFLFGVARQNAPGMQPAVKEGDLVLFYRLDKRYSASDLVAVEYEGGVKVLRVVAVAGDVVDITEHGVSVNGALQYERYTYGAETNQFNGGAVFPLTVEEDSVFLLGDDRANAEDSRIFGVVPIDETLGKVMAILRRRGF